MDPITQRIAAIGVVLAVLASIGGLAWIAVVHDGTIVPEVVQTMQNLITSVIVALGPILALVFHLKASGSTTPPTP